MTDINRPVILYVDDEEINLTNFTMFFDQDFEILTAKSGNEALKLFTSRQDLAVVITDQRMPGITGVQLLREIYRLNPDPIRIILTAYADVQDITEAINLGHIYHYVQKPWIYDKLHLVLQQAVDRYRLIRENKQLLIALEQQNNLLSATNERLEANLALQKQLEQQRREAEVKMLSQAKLASLGEIATGIAHEINQPLTYIQIILQATVRDITKGVLDLDELAAEMLESTRQVERITTIINHLRTFGRADIDDQEEISLPVILDNTLILYREKLRLNTIHLETTIADDLPLIRGNASQLEQVFINLFQNAFDAVTNTTTPEIAVHFTHEGDTVIITFSDNGCGLDEEVSAKIFEPFFTTKPIGQGTGLGLSIVYGIIADHNGAIECRSRPGQGCRFVITLPAA